MSAASSIMAAAQRKVGGGSRNQVTSVQRISLAIYRLKASRTVTNPFGGAIDQKNNTGVQILPVDLGADVAAQLAVRRSHPELPRWASFLLPVAQSLPTLLSPNAANSAALLVVQNDVRYAVTFGYGRALLEPKAIERGFGVRVALALINAASMRSVGYKEVDFTTIFANLQSNRPVRFNDFRVDTTSILLSGVVGTPDAKETYFTKALGADALHLNPAIRVADIPAFLDWIEKIRRNKKYRTLGYDWIDRVVTIQDPARIAALETSLDSDIKAGSISVSLGPPEPINHEMVVSFSVVGLYKETLDEIAIDDINRAKGAISVAILKLARITGLDAQGKVVQSWPAFDWVVWSHSGASKTTLLQAGTFFEVKNSFEAQIDDFISVNSGSLPTKWPDFIPATSKVSARWSASPTNGLGVPRELDGRGRWPDAHYSSC